MIQDIITHVLAAILPLAVVGGYVLWSRRHGIKVKSKSFVRPKPGFSDYIIYVYDEAGRVTKRFVYARIIGAIECFDAQHKSSRLFKDGEILEEK